ncbi:MAG: bile acid:sodium symporter family protein [Planctomycetaceae bacterium]
MRRALDLAANAFPLWVLAACGLALVEPACFSWFREPWISRGLGLVMLGMGLTLTPADFRGVAAHPATVAAGFVAQFLIMPAAGWGVATLLDLEPAFAAGVILVGCCPGGTASNVVTYIARGDVPLSVVMTACSTVGGVVLTPLLTKWLAERWVDVSAIDMLLATLTVVVLPVAAGVALNRLAPRVVLGVAPAAPLVSVLTIALICGSAIAQNAAAVRASGPRLLLAVGLLHAAGFALGHLVARALGYDRRIARTISIEVGMQNSGLGVVLAKTIAFPATAGVAPAAVPCAISAVTHSVIGSLLAGIWRLTASATASSPSRTA